MLCYVEANLGAAPEALTPALMKCHLLRRHARLAHADCRTGVLLLWHSGGAGGYASWCGIVKEQQTGVIVLSNSANGVDDLGERIQACLSDSTTSSIECS